MLTWQLTEIKCVISKITTTKNETNKLKLKYLKIKANKNDERT